MNCKCSIYALFAVVIPYMVLVFDTLLPGQSISGSKTLVSENGDFELGFFSPSPSGTKHYLGVQYKNLFGHPEWIDFPREGNNWSYDKCRRQWSLVDTDHLRFKYMNAFDQAMNALDQKFSFLSSSKQVVSDMNEEEKVIVFERGDLVFIFNFHPNKTYEGYKVGCDLPGKYRVALDSDAFIFGGHGRVGHDADHFTSPEGAPGVPETNFHNRPNSFRVLSPPRTCVAYYRVDEKAEGHKKEGAAASWKTAPEYIDVDATHVKETTHGEATSGSGAGFGKASAEDDSGKQGKKFVFRSSDKENK